MADEDYIDLLDWEGYRNCYDEDGPAHPQEYDYSVWTTKEGEHILVTELTDSHLQNIRNIVKSWEDSDWFQVLTEEQERRREMHSHRHKR